MWKMIKQKKSEIIKMSAVPQLICKVNAMSIKIPKIILIWKNKDNFQLKKVRRLVLGTQCLLKTIIMKVMWLKTRIFVL